MMFDKTPSDVDWARLAAYIDGEGCIRIASMKTKHAPRPYLYLDIRISNTSKVLMIWLKDTFGGKIYEFKHKNERWATSHQWMVACLYAGEILKGCLPHFVLKRDQAEVALEFQATKTKRWGVKGTPEDIIETQYALQEKLSRLKGSSARQKSYGRPEAIAASG
jgi:hypothetical protein